MSWSPCHKQIVVDEGVRATGLECLVLSPAPSIVQQSAGHVHRHAKRLMSLASGPA